jgi:FkbM family methyltransferase
MAYLRRILDLPLRALGFELIPKWRLATFAENYVHGELLRRVFDAKDVDCVFDVGAFNGHFGRFLREEVGYTGLILSFEPQPRALQQLDEERARDKKWQAFNCALGSTPGKFEFNLTAKPWFSSFLPPSATTPENMAGRNAVVEKIGVKVETIADLFDALSRTYGFQRPFLKMDTQGFDLRVFNGASNYVHRFLGLQSEVSVIPIYQDMPSWLQALEEYQKSGFQLSGLFPVSHDGDVRVVEFDAVLVRGATT